MHTHDDEKETKKKEIWYGYNVQMGDDIKNYVYNAGRYSYYVHIL